MKHAGLVVIGALILLAGLSLGLVAEGDAGYRAGVQDMLEIVAKENPHQCEATSSFRTINGQVLVTLLCPDSIGPRPKDTARRHE